MYIQVLSGTTPVASDGKFSRSLVLTHFQNGGFVNVGQVNGSYVGVTSIQWPGGSVPPDSPRCGWKGGECTEDERE